MINEKKVLGLIPARSGSKGIRKKNIIAINGLPLIAYTIIEAKKSSYLDDIVITTDSEEIGEVAKGYGVDVPFLRPKELATDTATTLQAVLHAIDSLKEMNRLYDIIVLLQPTSPLRTVDDIDNALELFINRKEQGLVSVSKVSDSPILMRKLQENNRLTNLLEQNSTIRRQDMPQIYRVNGSIYINLVSEINETISFNDNPIGFVMEKSHSVDVDDYCDISLVEYYLQNKEALSKNTTSK